MYFMENRLNTQRLYISGLLFMSFSKNVTNKLPIRLIVQDNKLRMEALEPVE